MAREERERDDDVIQHTMGIVTTAYNGGGRQAAPRPISMLVRGIRMLYRFRRQGFSTAVSLESHVAWSMDVSFIKRS